MPGSELNTRQRAVLLTLMAAGRELANPEMHATFGLQLQGRDRVRLNDAGLVSSRKVGRSFAHELTDRGWRACRDELRATPPRAPGSLGHALYAVLGALDAFLGRTDLRLADVFGDTGTPIPSGDPTAAGPAPMPAGAAAGAAATTAPGPAGAPGAGTTGTTGTTGAGTAGTGTAGTGARGGAGTSGARGGAEERVRRAYRALAAGRHRAWVSLTDLRAMIDADGSAPGRGEVDAALRALYRTPEANLVPESNQKALTAGDRRAAVRIGDEDKHMLSIELPVDER